MVSIALLAAWQLCSDECWPVELPMNVYDVVLGVRTALTELHEEKHRWIAERDWDLVGTVQESSSIISIDWIDTISEIYVNDLLIGTTNSSFLSYEFSLPSNTHTILIRLKSPVKYAQMMAAQGSELPKTLPPWAIGGVQYVRTAQSQFGWDWGPALPNIGIGNVVIGSFEHVSGVLVDTIRQTETEWSVRLRLQQGTPQFNVTISLDLEQIASHKFYRLDFSFSIQNVSPWWPRGYGEQNMYRLTVCDARKCIVEHIGFREVKFENSFLHVNDERIEILGTNLVPPSQFRPYESKLISDLFVTVLKSGLNLIRVWGGGYFGSSLLYELADKHGVIIWEELKFAGATYEWKNLWDVIVVEIDQNLRPRYNHPSLLIISGDNEIELMLQQNWYNADSVLLEQKLDEYRRFSNKLVEFLKALGSENRWAIIPSSPGKNEIHYYDLNADCRDERLFPKNTSLVSEYGYQSWAHPSTLDSVMRNTGDSEWLKRNYRDSELIQSRQHRTGGTEWLIEQANRIFESPPTRSVEWLLWISQIVQGICLKSATETFRRQVTNSGVMYWQLNDVWPTVSWSLIDFELKPKLAYHYIHSSFAKTLFSIYYEQSGFLVVGVKNARSVPAGRVTIANLYTGDIESILFEESIIENEYQEILRIPLETTICKTACVASLSSTNYVLINRNPIKTDRPNAIYITNVSPTRITVSVNVSTPFLFVQCEGGIFEPNSIFLMPSASAVLNTQTACTGAITVTSIWSKFVSDATPQIASE